MVGPAAAAAFVAYLLQAAVDWTWEIPVATVPALFCAAVLLAEAREPAGACCGAPPAVALALRGTRPGVGTRDARRQRCRRGECRAANRDEPERALREAKRAIAWAPWSEEPWQLRGEAELLLDDDAAAQPQLCSARSSSIRRAGSPGSTLPQSRSGAVTRARTRSGERLNPLGLEADELRTKP